MHARPGDSSPPYRLDRIGSTEQSGSSAHVGPRLALWRVKSGARRELRALRGRSDAASRRYQLDRIATTEQAAARELAITQTLSPSRLLRALPFERFGLRCGEQHQAQPDRARHRFERQ